MIMVVGSQNRTFRNLSEAGDGIICKTAHIVNRRDFLWLTRWGWLSKIGARGWTAAAGQPQARIGLAPRRGVAAGTMICKACQKQIPAGSQFCSNCGTRSDASKTGSQAPSATAVP
ncbi:MAG: zinc ribbon domain-containing protein, partial [Planctomycetes bacterium]|nr:zinc ribbon domain-containing protein [Planctomycetota bacterium]